MMGAIRRRIDAFWGSGESAITLPPMDGALRPNSRLDESEVLAQLDAPDNLATDGACVFLSRGSDILAFVPGAQAGGGPDSFPFASFSDTISCIAAHPSGQLAVGLDDGRIVIHGGKWNGTALTRLGDLDVRCPTAMAFLDETTLVVCLGSQQNAPSDWKRDLMERNQSGSVWQIDIPSKRAVRLADGLGYPYGVSLAKDGRIIVAEAWRHRLIAISRDAAPALVLGDLPGYPSRLAPGFAGGHWLAVFAPRRQMVEFVLREAGYRKRMMREIPQQYWMAPALRSGDSFREPLQGGAVKQLGTLKPWAPTRSYGLLLRLNDMYQPVDSLHSRADGRRHGITSALDLGDHVLVTSKGGNAVLKLDPALSSELGQ